MHYVHFHWDVITVLFIYLHGLNFLLLKIGFFTQNNFVYLVANFGLVDRKEITFEVAKKVFFFIAGAKNLSLCSCIYFL